MEKSPLNIDMLKQTAQKLGLPFVTLKQTKIDITVFDVLPVEDALRLCVAPFRDAEGKMRVAISDPENLLLENQLCHLTGGDVDLAVADQTEIIEYLRQADGSGQILKNVAHDFQVQIIRDTGQRQDDIVSLDAIVGETGVVKLFNSILMAALEKQVSDIHFELSDQRIGLKYRIDGILQPATDHIDVQFHDELVSRIKVLAELDIAEQRIPQDGRFRMRFDGRDIDFRVSVLPTQFGEDVVIRILDKAGFAEGGNGVSLNNLGFSTDDLETLRGAIREPHGLMLITGPTGSGKTTTLYGALGEMNTQEEKVITIEDPIEYQIPDIAQIPVNEKKKLTFASGLRSILRHDPDKIMIGEIRDRETAEIAIQAALTGHLVLASVHANNTQDVIGRFTHWGIDLFDFVAALNAVFAQRLFRRLCKNCKVDIGDGKCDAVGCVSCSQTGYKGRMAALEHLVVDEEISELIVNRELFGQLKAARVRKGMKTLDITAAQLVHDGLTSHAEFQRVLGDAYVK
jgi:type IV pilus assembly protein PilB